MSDTPRMTPAGRALVPYRSTAGAPRFARVASKRLVWGAALAGVFGLGALGTHGVQVAWSSVGHSRGITQAEATQQTLRRLEEELGQLKGSVDTLRVAADATRQDDSLRSLKHAVDAMKGDIQQARAADGASLQQLAAKLDKSEHDPSPKLAEIVARLDRIERDAAPKPATDAAQARIADIASRLDRVEHQVAPPPAPAAVPPPVHAAGAVTAVSRSAAPAPDKPADPLDGRTQPARAPTLDAWVLRDVYDGMALVEARHGGLREIGPGEFLPGAGKIQSIERRGRAWVVVTSRGVIENSTF